MKNFFDRVVGKVRRTVAPVAAKIRMGNRVAIIGAGRIAPTHIDAYREGGLATVEAICDVSPKSLGATLDRYPKLRAFRDASEMFEEIQPSIISICTWPQSHKEIVELAVANGIRGIMCEKPLALTMADVNEMLRCCVDANVKIAGGHQYRFHPMFVGAKKLLTNGQLGKITSVSGSIKSNLANNGPHLFDTIRFLLDDREALAAHCTCIRENDTYDRATPVEEGATGKVTFEDQIQVEFSTGTRSHEFFEIIVRGTSGELRVTPSGLAKDGKTVKTMNPRSLRYRRTQFSSFVKWVNGSATSYAADGVQSAKSNELVLALYESARLNETCELPLTNQGFIFRDLYPDAATPDATDSGSPTLNEVVPHDTALAIDGGKRSVDSWFEYKPHIGRDEWVGVAKVLASGNLNSVSGTVVKEFESAVAKTYETVGAVASTSGTASIHVALGILGLEPGDEVITTPITDMGSIIPILWCNAVPVFADIDPLTGNMTAETIKRQITDRTRAVVLVHLFGRPANVAGIKQVLDDRNIILIEDCAQAHLAKSTQQHVGTIGDFGCFSLQQAKQITCGDGGFTLINRESDLHRARLFVDKGWNRRGGSRAHEFLGMNYRMTELQGAVALAQLKKLPELIEARRSTASSLSDKLKSISGIVLPDSNPGDSPSWWIYNFCIDEQIIGVSPDVFASLLQVEGVRVGRRYLPRPIFEEDVLRNRVTYGTSGFPFSISESPQADAEQMPGLQEFMNRQMIIPWSSRAKRCHVNQIAEAVAKVAATRVCGPDPS